MFRYTRAAGTAAVFIGTLASHTSAIHAETFVLDPVVVEGSSVHRSQELMRDVEKGMNANRSNSYLGGAVLQNLNPVNSGDALRYNVPALAAAARSGPLVISVRQVRSTAGPRSGFRARKGAGTPTPWCRPSPSTGWRS